MPLREGSVFTLIEETDRGMSDGEIAEQVLYQMAKALKYMAKYKMVHRDIKHANILYETRMHADSMSAYYHFQLADFNLSNESAQARTFAGTPVFMAPEVYDRLLQSCTADIWSLFVTIVWIYNVDGFRTYSTDDNLELRNKITGIAQQDMFVHISDMAIQDPRRRVSARELVARLEGTSSSMPKSTRSKSAMTDMTIGPGVQDDDGDAYGYVPYITAEVAQGFSNTFASSSQQAMMATSSMNGLSALADFSLDAGPVQTHVRAYLRMGRILVLRKTSILHLSIHSNRILLTPLFHLSRSTITAASTNITSTQTNSLVTKISSSTPARSLTSRRKQRKKRKANRLTMIVIKKAKKRRILRQHMSS